MKIKFIIVFFLSLLTHNLYAQTIDTNISGIVIKDYRCNLKRWVEGNLINRNTTSFRGKLRVKIIDADGDIAWQGTSDTILGPQNGATFSVMVSVKDCLSPNKVQITLEP